MNKNDPTGQTHLEIQPAKAQNTAASFRVRIPGIVSIRQRIKVQKYAEMPCAEVFLVKVQWC